MISYNIAKLYFNFLMQKKKKRKTFQEQQTKAALAILNHPIYLQKSFRLLNKINVAD